MDGGGGGPPEPDIGRMFLVRCPIRELDLSKTTTPVEGPRSGVGLEDPEFEEVGSAVLGQINESTPEPPARSDRINIQLVEPIAVKDHESDDCILPVLGDPRFLFPDHHIANPSEYIIGVMDRAECLAEKLIGSASRSVSFRHSRPESLVEYEHSRLVCHFSWPRPTRSDEGAATSQEPNVAVPPPI